MNDKSTTNDQGFGAGVPRTQSAQEQRNAQSDQTDPSIDVDIDIDDGDEGEEKGDSRQAGSGHQDGDAKVAPGSGHEKK